MTPTHLMLCLALVSSVFGMTSETPDDLRNTSNLQLQNPNQVEKTIIDVELVGFINNTALSKKTIPNQVKNYIQYDMVMYNSKKPNKNIKNNLRTWNINAKVPTKSKTLSRTKRENDPKCSKFAELDGDTFHSPGWPDNYYKDLDCITVISAPSQIDDYIIILDFRDKFHLEFDPNCTYDFLEIRDGKEGYADLIDIYCGDKFPKVIHSQGPNLWLRFKSDSTIEYEGFTGVVSFNRSSNSRKPADDCIKNVTENIQGVVKRDNITTACELASKGRVDAVWKIIVKEGWRIFLNFTQFSLAYPNECKMNFVDVFGEKADMPHRLENFCGSMADTVTSSSNVIHIRFYAVSEALAKTNFSAHFTAFRPRDTHSTCDTSEFDCDDATCIHKSLRCDGWPNCRLKGDEDTELCSTETESPIGETHIVIILVIFSLILSSMSFVFVFKCIKKLVSDHKIIKEHIRQSCEDRLDMIASSKLMLDPRLLQPDMSRHRDSLQRERDSLRRDNHRNSEMYKQQRSRDKPGSIDSELIVETHIDLDDDPWHQNIDEEPEMDERHSKNKAAKPKSKDKKDIRKSEEKVTKEKEFKHKDKKESERKTDKRTLDRKNTDKKTSDRRDADRTIDRRGTTERRDALGRNDTDRKEKEEDQGRRSVSVGAPDTKESGCQTRESLFQGGTGASSDGTDSGPGARGFSTFGYSGSTLLPARRSSPPPPASPPISLTIELLKACQPAEPQSKKMPDRRPMSTETTRSAPDVIIVSKPVR